MKRFYCKVCKKIKRVRQFPRTISTPKAENPADRIGVCNRHNSAVASFNSAKFSNKKELVGVK